MLGVRLDPKLRTRLYVKTLTSGPVAPPCGLSPLYGVWILTKQARGQHGKANRAPYPRAQTCFNFIRPFHQHM